MSVLETLALAGSALGSEQGFAVPWARIVLAFLFCIGLALTAIAFVRWRSGQGGLGGLRQPAMRGAGKRRELELVERLSLGPTSQLVLVRCGNKRLLILSSASGARLVSELDVDAAAEDGA